jgi:hypothetical protein
MSFPSNDQQIDAALELDLLDAMLLGTISMSGSIPVDFTLTLITTYGK